MQSYVPAQDGDSGMAGGTWCLLKYDDDNCGEIVNSEMYSISFTEVPVCRNLDRKYKSFSFERVPDEWVSA